MKRAWYVAAVVALALVAPAISQVRGASASVTSMAPGRGANPGPPASVTSLGPRGYGHPTNFSTNCSAGGISPLVPSAMGCTPTQFTSGFFFPDARNRGTINLGTQRRRRANTNAYYPVYVPYAYPVAVGSEAEQEAEENDPPAPTIFEHRSSSARVPVAAAEPQRRGRNYLDSGEQQPVPAVELSPAEARQQIPIVLIYRDGHQQEVTNYAIVGQTLYDLGTFVAHKIPLADLNLKETIKANDDRGVEFALPASVKMD